MKERERMEREGRLARKKKGKKNTQEKDPSTFEGRSHQAERWRVQEKRKERKWKKRVKRKKKNKEKFSKRKWCKEFIISLCYDESDVGGEGKQQK